MSDDKRYTVAIVGCGRVAALHAEAYTHLPATQLVAAADIDAHKMDLFCERWSIPQRYRSYEEMLAQANVDIVSVCTMDNLKGPVTIAAAGAGARGILCEKPMAFHLDEADRMIAACDRAGAKLIVNHSMRFEANYTDVKKMIEQGGIGNLRTIRGHLLTSDQRDPASWHSHYETAGGGNMMHDVTHLFDLIRFYAGEPEWVFATVERGNKTLTIEDLGAGLFRMDSGCLFFFESGGRRRYGTFEILIEGDEGRLAIQHGAGNSLERSGGNGWEPYLHRWRMQTEPVAWEPLATQRQHAWINAVSDLVDCIDQDRESVSSGRQGRAALEMIMAVYESQRRGLARVDFPLEIRDNPFGDMLERGRI